MNRSPLSASIAALPQPRFARLQPAPRFGALNSEEQTHLNKTQTLNENLGRWHQWIATLNHIENELLAQEKTLSFPSESKRANEKQKNDGSIPTQVLASCLELISKLRNHESNIKTLPSLMLNGEIQPYQQLLPELGARCAHLKAQIEQLALQAVAQHNLQQLTWLLEQMKSSTGGYNTPRYRHLQTTPAVSQAIIERMEHLGQEARVKLFAKASALVATIDPATINPATDKDGDTPDEAEAPPAGDQS